jgi:hypothetical protein
MTKKTPLPFGEAAFFVPIFCANISLEIGGERDFRP